jgi:Na+/proline symporter
MTFLARPVIMATAAVYLILVVMIGAWAARRTRSAKDFWIAGQGIGLIVTGLATTSAAFSGFVFIGGPGMFYRMGMASLFIVIPVSFSAGLICWVVAKRLRLLAEVREVFTIPDAILVRYKSRAASGLAGVAVVVGVVAYLGSQLLALGRMVEAVFGTREIFGDGSLPIAMAVGMAVIVFYSIAGGMVAGVYTDLLQGSMMAVVASVVFFRAISVGGGLTQVTESIAGSSEFGTAFLEPFGTVPIYTALGFFFVFLIGNLGQPHILHKFYMLDDPLKLKWMPLVVGVTQTLCVLIWLGIGLAVPALVAQGKMAALTQPDDAAPLFLLNFAPQLLAGLVFAGILAAIMSTADSFVNIGSAAVVRDIPKALGKSVIRELYWGRIAVLVIALLAAGLAHVHGDLVVLLGTFAFGTFGAALAPALAIGLNWRRVTATAAIASMSTGIALNVTLELLARAQMLPFAPGVLPTAVSMAMSFTVLLLVSWLSSDSEVDEDVEAVMEA